MRAWRIWIGLASLAFLATGVEAQPCANSTVSSNCLRLVGSSGGVADPSGAFSVTVRDCVPNPIAGVYVVIDFSSCTDTHVGSQGDQPNPGMTVDGSTRTVTMVTDSNGKAEFRIVGAVNPATRGSVAPSGCASIYADGVLLTKVTVNAFDHDGLAGLGLADLALWTSDLYGGASQPRSNYDCSSSAPIVALPDLSIWALDYFSHNARASAGAYAW